ncbi:MAG: LytR family transcriptional regulator [Actinobacteria bacterium HGW-Actinobacteria-2]|nr:MAG: LytR family transcriptional regulator [Actinobacteria bacterium HGW-Actinobacteria-2]
MTSSPGPAASGSPTPRRIAIDDTTADGGVRPGFGGAVGWTVLGSLIPGVGYLRSGRKVLGFSILGVLILGIFGIGAYAILNRQALTQLATNQTVLYAVAGGLLVFALAWVTIITTTHLSLRPRPATAAQRIIGGALVGVLSFAVAAPLAFGANLAYTTAGGLSIFDSSDGTTNTADPWAGQDRVNILLLGGDSGVKSHRSLAVGARTDTVMVASIDTHTGAATLITLPRNATQMPFPADSPLHKYYPRGFTDPSGNLLNAEYLLNAMYRNVPAQVPNNLLGKTKDFGASVVMQSAGEALGLKINYYAFVNMDGFKDFINAIGGITVNVNYRIPVGGHNASGNQPAQAPTEWIEVGPNKHLTGGYALWYARGRYKLDDYSRMERQRCVINAVVKQADPANILLNFQAILTTGEKNISTNIPRDLLPAMVDLAMKTKNTKVRSLVLDPSNGFYSWKPDWPKVRSQVQRALDSAATNAQPTTDPSAAPSTSTAPTGPASTPPTSGTPTTTAPTAGSTPSTTTGSKDKSDDLDSACAYNPHKYAEK